MSAVMEPENMGPDMIKIPESIGFPRPTAGPVTGEHSRCPDWGQAAEAAAAPCERPTGHITLSQPFESGRSLR
ncbi:MAG: hypothetical protein Tsb0032_00520 [Kiloniellaceae bacterium]